MENMRRVRYILLLAAAMFYLSESGQLRAEAAYGTAAVPMSSGLAMGGSELEDDGGQCSETFNTCSYDHGLPMVCTQVLFTGVQHTCIWLGDDGDAVCDPNLPGPMFVKCWGGAEWKCNKFGENCVLTFLPS